MDYSSNFNFKWLVSNLYLITSWLGPCAVGDFVKLEVKDFYPSTARQTTGQIIDGEVRMSTAYSPSEGQ